MPRPHPWLKTAALCVLTASLLLPLTPLPSAADGPLVDDPDIPFVFGFDFAEVQVAQQKAAPPAKAEAQPGQEQAGKPAEAEGEQGGNPLLRNLIRGLIPKTEPNRPILRRAGDDAELIPMEHEEGLRDAVDALAPFVSPVTKTLDKARKSIDDGRTDAALEQLQLVLDHPEDSLVRTRSGRALSTRLIANRLLGSLPADDIDRYRLQHGDSARRLLDSAKSSSDVQILVEVATRYFHTAAGQEAADRLGTMYLDRGQFGMASRWYTLLWEFDSDVTQDARWRAKAALAFRESNQSERLEQLWPTTQDQEPVLLAGRDVGDFREWLETIPPIEAPDRRAVEEWWTLYGNSDRTARLRGGTPVLIPRWSIPLTENQLIIEQLQDIADDLEDQQRAPVPTMYPITVNGQVAFRTLRGVQIADAVSGTALWQTREDWSPDQLLTRGLVSRYQPQSSDRHPLVNLLYRDAVFGLISTDGRRLFVLENHALMSQNQPGYSPWNGQIHHNDRLRRDWSVNKLVAYDVRGGHPAWEAGGTRFNEQLDLPLAGHYFYGPPTLDRDELLLVGENEEREIRLFGLDPESGASNWSQLIGYCDAGIDQDLGRRWWISQVAARNGVVVVPTTTGWLVAVDRLNHSLLWAYRFSTPNENKGHRPSAKQRSVVPYKSLNERWSPSAPIISGRFVVFTPPEENVIVCLDLLSGERKWQAPQSTFLYLAGVFDERVLLVGRQSITALALDTGTTIWTRPFDSTDGTPSGRGVAVDEDYLLPLTGGGLLTLAIADGTLKQRTFLPPDHQPLGNLLMYRGQLLSLNTFAITAYELRENLESQITAGRQQDETRAHAQLLQARLLKLDRKLPAALKILQSLNESSFQPHEAGEFRQLMFETLAELVQEDSEQAEQHLGELSKWADSKEQKLRVRILAARFYRQTEQFAAAIDTYWKLLDTPDDYELERADSKRLYVRFDRWLSGELTELWNAADSNSRDLMTQRVASETQQATSIEQREQFLNRFGFHPLSSQVRLALLRSYLLANQLAEAEHHALVLHNNTDPLGPQALAALATSFVAHGWHRDAEHLLTQLESYDPQLEVESQQTVKQFVEAMRSTQDWDQLARQVVPIWNSTSADVRTAGADYNLNAIKSLETAHFRQPSLQQYRYEFNQNLNRLAIINPFTNEIVWSVPLKGNNSHGTKPKLHEAGHRIVLMLKSDLYCLAPLEKRILWSVETGTPRSNSGTVYYSSRNRDPEQFYWGVDLTRYHSFYSSLASRRPMGLLAANDMIACCEERRGFRIVDLRDGSTLWRNNRVGHRVRVALTDDYVITSPVSGGTPQVYRAVNGEPVDVPKLGPLLQKTVAFQGNGCVVLEERSGISLFGIGNSRPQLRLHDPFTGTDIWKLDLSGEVGLAQPRPGQFLALRNGSELAWINLQTGQFEPFTTIKQLTASRSTRVVAVADLQHLYVFAADRNSYQSFHSEIRTIPVSGDVYCLNLDNGELNWKSNVDAQNLVVTEFDTNPVLLLTGTHYERRAKISLYNLRLTAINKQTGKTWIDYKLPTSGFQGFAIDLPERFIEVRTYNSRIRLMAADELAVRPGDADSEPVKQPNAGSSEEIDASGEDATEAAGGTR